MEPKGSDQEEKEKKSLVMVPKEASKPMPYVFSGTKFEVFQCSHPAPRSEHRMVADKHYVHVFGGLNATANGTHADLWRFSKLTRNWKRLETTGNAPTHVLSTCMVQLNPGQLLVFGGTGYPHGEALSNKMHICNLTSLHWEEVIYSNEPDDNQIPEPGFGQAMLLDKKNQCLYLSGGTSSIIHPDYKLCIHRFDLATRRWERLAAYSDNAYPRFHHGMALYRNKLFIIGGGQTDAAYRLDFIPTFFLKSRKWVVLHTRQWENKTNNKVKTYPDARYGHGCVQIGCRVYVVGGQNPLAIFEDLWSLDLKKLAWTKYTDIYMPTGCYYHAAAISPIGELLIFGGVTCHGKEKRTNRFLRAWLQPPRLELLAKEAIRSQLEFKLNEEQQTPQRRILRKPDLEHIQEALLGINLNFIDLPYF